MSDQSDKAIAQGMSMYWHAKHGTSYRDAIIEECARVAQAKLEDHSDSSLAEWVAAAIRALKDKQ